MKTSIAPVSISGDLREKLAAIAAAGFDGVEIFENDFLANEGPPAEVGRMVRDHGLEITLFQPFRDFEGLPESQRIRAFERAERKFDLMQELGPDARLLQRVTGRARRHRPGRRRLPRTRPASGEAVCASVTRRWPGAGTSAIIVTPGRSSAAPITAMSG